MKRTIFILLNSALLSISGYAQQCWNLEQCIDHALSHNITILKQEQNVESGKVMLHTAQHKRLPDLNASASQSFNFGRGLTVDNTYANRNTQSTGFDLSTNIPIFTGGQIGNDIALKKLDLQAALADLDKARENISIQVTAAYLEALYQQELRDIARDQLALSRSQEERIRALYENGKRSESEWAEARSSTANDELTLTQNENAYQLALLDLSQLLELPTPEGFNIVKPETQPDLTTPLPLPDALFAEAVVIKPQILAEQYRLDGMQKNIRIAQSALYPSLHFGAGLGTSYYKTSGFEASSFGRQLKDNLNKYIGFSLSIPIFNRFATRNNIKNARIQQVSQHLQLEEVKKGLYKEIQQAYYNAVAAQKQCLSSQTAEAAGQSAFNLMTLKYDTGKATATEYQESKTRLMKAKADLAQAQYTYIFRVKILDFYRGTALK